MTNILRFFARLFSKGREPSPSFRLIELSEGAFAIWTREGSVLLPLPAAEILIARLKTVIEREQIRQIILERNLERGPQ